MKKSLVVLLLIGLGIIYAIPLRILYTNDSHGSHLPRTYTIEGQKTELGGYASLEHHLSRERSSATRSIYLDAGDQQTGTIFSSLEHDGAIGGAVIKVFNHLGLEATCYGNHEFDINPENTRKLSQLARYPFLSTNIIERKTASHFPVKPYHIITQDSLSIGLMGLTMTDLDERVKASNVAGLDLIPYKAAIDRYLEELDAKTDLIILLTHLGVEADSLLALSLDERIDLIIGGHSHTVLAQPLVVNGIPILQTGAYLAYLGKLDIEVEQDRIKSYTNQLIPLKTVALLPLSPLISFVEEIKAQIDQSLGEVIGTLPYAWEPDKYRSTQVSQWMAEALEQDYQSYKPDFAMINCGGIRKYVHQGPITLRDMHEVLPFGNTVTLFSATGTDLITFWAKHSSSLADPEHDIVETTFPGLHQGKKHASDKSPEAYSWYLNGTDAWIDPSRSYRIVSHDFLAGQGDKYLGFAPLDVYDTGDLLLDAMIRQVRLQFGSQK